MANGDILTALNDTQPAFSFEFFPPKDPTGHQVLWESIGQVREHSPAFVSVTYGAGGSTRDRTLDIVSRLVQDTDLRTLAHLTCVGSPVSEIHQILDDFAAAGIQDLLALRGDPAGGVGTPWEPHPEGLNHADDLISLASHRGGFTIGAAAFPDGHPEAVGTDATTLARKAQAGASFAITQMVTDVGAYERLREDASTLGCDMPIIPSILPVTKHGQLQHLTKLNGQPLSSAVLERLDAVKDNPRAVREVGLTIAVEHTEQLLASGAPGVHFITMNRAGAVLEVLSRIDHAPRPALARTNISSLL